MNFRILIFFLLLFNLSYSQTKSSLICKRVDEFTDEVNYTTVDYITNYEDGGDMSSEGMVFSVLIIEQKGQIVINGLYVKVFGIKGCVDKGSTLDILFENGEKTQLVNLYKFDCEGKNLFRLNNEQLDLLKSSSVKGFKYTNKRNYDTMISKNNLDDKAKNYIKNTLLEVDKVNSGEVIIGICED
jgi:hypothetical protein